MRLLRPLAEELHARLRRLRRGLQARWLPVGDRREELSDRVRDLVRIDFASERDDDLLRRVTAVHEVAYLARRHAEHDLLATGDLPAQRMVRVQELVDQ